MTNRSLAAAGSRDRTTEPRRMKSVFERCLSVWVALCILGGILLGKAAPEFAHGLDGMALYVDAVAVVSIPIAIPLFVETVVIFALGYGLARWPRLSYENAAPAAMIGASNHFLIVPIWRGRECRFAIA